MALHGSDAAMPQAVIGDRECLCERVQVALGAGGDGSGELVEQGGGDTGAGAAHGSRRAMIPCHDAVQPQQRLRTVVRCHGSDVAARIRLQRVHYRPCVARKWRELRRPAFVGQSRCPPSAPLRSDFVNGLGLAEGFGLLCRPLAAKGLQFARITILACVEPRDLRVELVEHARSLLGRETIHRYLHHARQRKFAASTQSQARAVQRGVLACGAPRRQASGQEQ